MNRRAQAAGALVALGVAGTVAVVPAVTRDKPAVKGLISQPAVNDCHVVPGKKWGGVWHYSPLILRPTRTETYCVTQPHPVGRIVTVTVAAVP